MSEVKHSPTPWWASGRWIKSAGELVVCQMDGVGHQQDAANRDLIVMAVNHHDELVTVCRMLVAAQSGDVGDVITAMDAAREVIRKVDGDA